MTEITSETEIVWMARDKSDGLYLTANGRWSGKKSCGEWSTPEAAARVLMSAGADRFSSLELLREERVISFFQPVSDILPPPQNIGVVPSSWVALSGRLDPKLMLNAKRIVDSRGVDPMDIPAVRDIFAELWVAPSR